MQAPSVTVSAFVTLTTCYLFHSAPLTAQPVTNSTKVAGNPDSITPLSSSTQPPIIPSVPSTEKFIEPQFSKPQFPASPAAILGQHAISQQTISQQTPIPVPLPGPETSPSQSSPATPSSLPSPQEIDQLQQELNSFQPPPETPYRASPGITISVPSGFGADRNRFFAGLGLQRTRIPTTDGGAVLGVGLGDSRKFVGIQISYTIVSISPTRGSEFRTSARPFGSGSFNLKIHRQFPRGWSAAIGADGLVNIGRVSDGDRFSNYNEFEKTYYAVVTHIVPLQEDVNASFSRVALNVGIGSGRFRTEEQILNNKSSVIFNPFASIALRITPSTSLITEWTGQDLGVGLSIVPFRNLPLVLTPAIRDLAGPDAEKPRFILGVGLSL